jgi:hypothetical protein
MPAAKGSENTQAVYKPGGYRGAFAKVKATASQKAFDGTLRETGSPEEMESPNHLIRNERSQFTASHISLLK